MDLPENHWTPDAKRQGNGTQHTQVEHDEKVTAEKYFEGTTVVTH